MLYYRKCATRGEEPWKICARSEDEKKRILESCHAILFYRILFTSLICVIKIFEIYYHAGYCSSAQGVNGP